MAREGLISGWKELGASPEALAALLTVVSLAAQ
jgi:hypothetical protein